MNSTMQMNGMNPGGPQGAMLMQQQAPNGAMGRPVDQLNEGNKIDQHQTQLNTAIYDYFLKTQSYELARALKNSGLSLKLADSNKRKADDDDGKDDPNRPADLPLPGFPLHPLASDTAFLLDWYSLFFDLFTKDTKNNMATQYLQHTQNLNRLTQQQQQNIMRQGMMPNMNAQAMMQRGLMRPNQMMNPQFMQQQQQARVRMMQQQANMPREGSVIDGDGNRPRTPSSGENAPSPSKRARLDGQGFNPGMMNGMVPGNQMGNPHMMQQQQRAQDILAANGINPQGITPQQMQNFGAQNPQRANMAGQGSPNMMNPGMDMQMQGGNGDFYGNGNNMNRAGVNGPNGHALQDYQMQLMLLERQNRKRLEMAKQEQEVGGPGGQNGNMAAMQFAPNMSPSGSRQGPSPNPSEQMKRGTPQIGKAGIPGSPMPDGGPRASPSAMNYNQMGPGMENGMPANANGMRPPSSHPNFANGAPGMNQQQMQAMRTAQQGGPMPGGPGFPPGQQGPIGGPGNQQPGPNGQMGTPRQGNSAMPPPAGVPPSTQQNATGRAPSPAPSAAASTPQQSNKANPKKKDNKKDRKPSAKKANNAAASAENTDAPATSQPATPITPAMNANSDAFNKNKAAGATGPNANGAQANGAPPSGPQASLNAQPAAPGAEMGHDQNGGDLSMGNPGFELDFANMEAGDVLDSFNFDAFIENGDQSLDNFNFDMGAFDNNMESTIGNEA